MIGKMLGNRYEIIEKIGEGGMGLVYKARCHLLNRYVAIKMLKPEYTGDEEFINRFKKESLSSASLSHPNIVNTYDVGVEDGIYYIVMEYVKGRTLKEIIKEKAPFNYQEVINISRQICLALEHAHNNNIIHRDIKPQNILITHDGIVKVADFGIARASNSATLTNTGSVIGSVYYISPEQARGGYTDEKTDIYSLGTVMYEMATAKVPFIADSPVAIALKHIQDSVDRPSGINPDIPVALEDIILRSLEKNPAMRYEAAASLIKDLDKAAANPDIHLLSRSENPNDITKVMPAIKDDYIKNKDGAKPHAKKSSVNKAWLIAAVSIVTIAIVTGLLLLSPGSKPRDVAVPTILGMSEDNARNTLQSFNLSMDVVGRINSDKPKGTIIWTSPDVGMNVKENSSVKVKISAGPEQVSMPPLTGKTRTDALYLLDQYGLKYDTIEVFDETNEKDTVMNQDPAAGEQVSKGASVKVYISKGPEVKAVKMPVLVGVAYDKVEQILKDNKLTLGKVSYDYDRTKPEGVVLKASAEEGVQVVEGQAIDITVNSSENVTR